MTGLNNQSYLFEVIRRPTDDETNKDKDNKQTKIIRGSHNTYINFIWMLANSVVESGLMYLLHPYTLVFQVASR